MAGSVHLSPVRNTSTDPVEAPIQEIPSENDGGSGASAVSQEDATAFVAPSSAQRAFSGIWNTLWDATLAFHKALARESMIAVTGGCSGDGIQPEPSAPLPDLPNLDGGVPDQSCDETVKNILSVKSDPALQPLVDLITFPELQLSTDGTNSLYLNSTNDQLLSMTPSAPVAWMKSGDLLFVAFRTPLGQSSADFYNPTFEITGPLAVGVYNISSGSPVPVIVGGSVKTADGDVSNFILLSGYYNPQAMDMFKDQLLVVVDQYTYVFNESEGTYSQAALKTVVAINPESFLPTAPFTCETPDAGTP